MATDIEQLKKLLAEAQAAEQKAQPAPHAAPVIAKPAPKERATSSEWALGIVLLVAGGIGWLAGSKYTLFGWVVGLNLFLTWLGLPLRVPAVSGWWVLLAIPLGIIYSRVETRVWGRRQSMSLMRTPVFWAGWLVIVASDVGSTWLGVRVVNADSWTITQQIAASGGFALLWSVVLTFAPEWLILGSMKFLRW